MARSIRLAGGFDTSFIIEGKIPDPEKWRMASEYRCRHCDEPAYIDPNSREIWGCLQKLCSYSTEALAHFFKPAFLIEEEERQKIIATD